MTMMNPYLLASGSTVLYRVLQAAVEGRAEGEAFIATVIHDEKKGGGCRDHVAAKAVIGRGGSAVDGLASYTVWHWFFFFFFFFF